VEITHNSQYTNIPDIKINKYLTHALYIGEVSRLTIRHSMCVLLDMPAEAVFAGEHVGAFIHNPTDGSFVPPAYETRTRTNLLGRFQYVGTGNDTHLNKIKCVPSVASNRLL